MTIERIEINPAVMLGKPVIRGTRIMVELILRKLAEGETESGLLEDYPYLTAEDIRAAIAYGRRACRTRICPSNRPVPTENLEPVLSSSNDDDHGSTPCATRALIVPSLVPCLCCFKSFSWR
jgi:uncharacterized protein (DUF433 family)